MILHLDAALSIVDSELQRRGHDPKIGRWGEVRKGQNPRTPDLKEKGSIGRLIDQWS